FAPGSYDVRVNDSTNCAAFLFNAFKVVATPTLTVSSITPAFGSGGSNTAVVIAGSGFVSTPRVYLNNPNATGNPADLHAQALAAVTFQSATSLTGVVRSGLAAGRYDLLVVNPD